MNIEQTREALLSGGILTFIDVNGVVTRVPAEAARAPAVDPADKARAVEVMVAELALYGCKVDVSAMLGSPTTVWVD